MSSKDLDDICSSDEWGESMDVAESETTPGLNSEENVNTASNVPSVQVSQPLSPSIEMSESNEVRPQKSPIEMDPVSPSDRSTEVEMMNDPNPSDDAEMKDLSVKSPEDIGELKSPSPTVDMADDNAVESMKSPIVPAIEMNEPTEDNIESEILNSPSPPKDQEEPNLDDDIHQKSSLDNDISAEEEALKSPVGRENNDESVGENTTPVDELESAGTTNLEDENQTKESFDEESTGNLIEKESEDLEKEPSEENLEKEPREENLEKDPSEENVPEEPTEMDKSEESLAEMEALDVPEKVAESSDKVDESKSDDERAEDSISETPETEKDSIADTSDDKIETEKPEETDKSTDLEEERETPNTEKDESFDENKKDDKSKEDVSSEETEIKEKDTLSVEESTQMSDGIGGDIESVNNFDDESQLSGEASKDAVDKLDTVEGVTVPGGADGDVNVEEELGDDPLGAAADDADDKEHTDEPMDEEILGDTASEVSILPHSEKSSAGSAEGEEILSDTKKDKATTEEVKEKSPIVVEEEDKETDKEKSPEVKHSEESTETVKTIDKIKEDKDEVTVETKADKDETSEIDIVDNPIDTVETKNEDIVEIKDDPPEPAAPEIEVMEIDDDDDNADKSKDGDFSEDLITAVEENCHFCKKVKDCIYKIKSDLVADVELFFCDKTCRSAYHARRNKKLTVVASSTLEAPRVEQEQDMEPFNMEDALKRRCSQCKQEVSGHKEENLSWETMDFCNEDCLGIYQKELGSACANCKGPVMSSSMGKYCVRFGFNVRQFCTGTCLEEFKKGLKVCTYCQRDITGDVEGFLAPIGDKGQFKDFCSQLCMQNFEIMNCKVRPPERARCAVCCEEKDVAAEVLQLHGADQKLCSHPCLAAFKFANNLQSEVCEMCKKHFDLRRPDRHIVYYNDVRHHFCSKTCLNVSTLANRKIVACNWCKVKKYNFDMIRKVVAPTATQGSQVVMLCSLNCLALYQVSVSATSSKFISCDHCHKRAQGMYHLTMSDATLRNFCSYNCCMSFQSQFSSSPIIAQHSATTPTPISTPMRISDAPVTQASVSSQQMPVISHVTSLAATEPLPPPPPPPPAQVKILQQTFVKPAAPKKGVNKMTQCKPNMFTKGVSCRPISSSKGCQTDEPEPQKVLIPIPVPIYIPAPMHMFSQPFPVPVPFPLPIPVPIFVPTTRNTAKGIRKEIKRIQEQIPRDPFEAELLMMAEMVAEDKRGDATSSDSDDDNGADLGADNASSPAPEPLADSPAHSGGDDVEFNSEGVDPTPPTFSEDMLQMALKMASELTEPSTTPTMDLETALPVSVQPPPPPQIHQVEEEEVKAPETRVTRKRSRGRSGGDWAPPNVMPSSKRSRTNSQDTAGGGAANQQAARTSNGSPPAEPPDPAIEADPNLSLKFSYGVLAFRKWIRQKNAELLSKSGRAAKLFKTDILQLSTDELNFALCMFVKEVRKPDGDEYAPDIIYYLCLGIQLYLYRSNRIDNIFTDAYYEKFTESLNEISTKFVARLNDRTLVTRVEEEHLWESQQLGAHSPHVLLYTLMFFNTKYFLLTEVEDHMRLSFTHVMKHWKRNHAQPGKTGSTRNVLLRYYPPQAVLDADERKKKVYEQQENEQNPLRCPVKLYEFYVSKCPESVRGRNDVFYLLPERSCVPDSPVWYSTMALPRDSISRMLNRIRMVREVLNLLHSLNY